MNACNPNNVSKLRAIFRGMKVLRSVRGPTKVSATCSRTFTIALLGNPNAGKTTLFNALTGLRAKTANFAGTTVEHRIGRMYIGNEQIALIDLPGLYSLSCTSPEEKIAIDALRGKIVGNSRPDVLIVVVDAMNLERNLFLVSEVLELRRPIIVALNMMDLARRNGIHIDPTKLSTELGCAVMPISARDGAGIGELKNKIARLTKSKSAPSAGFFKSGCAGCSGCAFQARYEWTEKISSRVMDARAARRSVWTDKLDRIFTHSIGGVVIFLFVMLSLFSLIFAAAKIPMNLIDHLFAAMSGWATGKIPAGDLQSLLVNGVIGGVGGILVFLPQICILFFALSLLEDTGYLSRAAFVMDKIMRRFGLPGKAFIPMLSAHACAIPAIMSTRVIENSRDRLVTILITPLMSCSARIPVYAMLTAIIFPGSPFKAALVFTGAYATGVLAAFGTALIFQGTILPGGSKALLIELPQYRMPGFRTAFLHTFDRAKIFVKQAGTIIFFVSLALWALSYYPKSVPPASAATMNQQAAQFERSGDKIKAMELRNSADVLTKKSALENSFAGKIGHAIEPAIAPLGYNWQIGIGIISSFAAREVIVSTLAIVYGESESSAGHNNHSLYDSLRHATRPDGTPIFNIATCASLLVFYILAAQCLSTTAVVYRETNSWKWPLFQIAYMTGLAYGAAFVVYQVLRHFGEA